MKKFILLVDDEEEILDLLKTMLERRGYDVATAADGKEGLAAARDKMPDLIIMDVMMPNMTGREAAQILSEDISTKHIPVIFLSGTAYNTSEGKISEPIEIGGKEFPTIAKPFELEKVLDKVRKVLEDR